MKAAQLGSRVSVRPQLYRLVHHSVAGAVLMVPAKSVHPYPCSRPNWRLLRCRTIVILGH